MNESLNTIISATGAFLLCVFAFPVLILLLWQLFKLLISLIWQIVELFILPYIYSWRRARLERDAATVFIQKHESYRAGITGCSSSGMATGEQVNKSDISGVILDRESQGARV